MTFDQKQKTALFRYSVIAPLETGNSDPSISNNAFFRQAAAKSYTNPEGKTVTVGASTIEKWHRAYKKYARQKLRLRYSPDMEKVFVVEPSGELTPIRLLNKQDNAYVKRERVRLSDGGREE